MLQFLTELQINWKLIFKITFDSHLVLGEMLFPITPTTLTSTCIFIANVWLISKMIVILCVLNNIWQKRAQSTHILHLKPSLSLLHMYHPAWEHSSVPSQSFSWSRRLQLFLILLSVMLDALELYDYSCVCAYVCVCVHACVRACVCVCVRVCVLTICSHLAPSQGKSTRS